MKPGISIQRTGWIPPSAVRTEEHGLQVDPADLRYGIRVISGRSGQELHHDELPALVFQRRERLGQVKTAQLQIHHREIEAFTQVDGGGGAGDQRLDIRMGGEHGPDRGQHPGKMARAKDRHDIQPGGGLFRVLPEGPLSLRDDDTDLFHPPRSLLHEQ